MKKNYLPILLFIILLFISCKFNNKKMPIAKNGKYNLTNWDFNKDGPINLNGYWEFYWKQLLTPDDFKTDKPKLTGYINTPGIWQNYKLSSGEKLKDTGYATYRLIVETDNLNEDNILSISNMLNPYVLYINGKLFMKNGKIAKVKKNMIAQNYKIVKDFRFTSQETEFILQVCSHNYAGGLRSKILIMDEEAYIRSSFRDNIINGIMIGIIFFMFIYHLIIFFIKKNEKSSFYFSIFCFLIVLRILSQFNYINFNFLSNLYQNIIVKIEFISFYLAVPVFLFFMYELFKNYFKKIINYIFLIISIIATSIVLIAPIRIFEILTLRIYQYVTFGAVIYTIICVVIAVIKGKKRAIVSLIGFIILSITVIYDIILAQTNVVFSFIISYGVTAFCLSQSVILLLLFGNSFRQVENLSKELENNNKQLVLLDKLKDDFLANTSHELRTPLTGIIGLAESMIDGVAGKMSQKAVKNLQMIKFSGKRLCHLVNDILDYSKLRNNNIRLKLNPMNIYSITNIVLSVLKPLTSRKNMDLINDISKDVPLIYADENRIQQILYNLLGNAIKFTPSGTVKISANFPPVSKYFEDKKNYLEIIISDTGIGIPADKFDAIFNSFEQVDGSVSREYGGSGLGLTITKQLIELHRGNIKVESKIGEGSKFIFIIPISKKKTGSDLDYSNLMEKVSAIDNVLEVAKEIIDENVYSSYDDAKIYTILAVDDEPINLQVLENILTLQNYTVLKAYNGNEALNIINNHGTEIDIVILDIMMPQMSGIEVCEVIRKDYKLNKLPIIMVTAKNRITDLVQGLSIGANDYLTKPFIKEELLARIRNLLELRERTNELIKTRIIGMHALAELTELKDTYTGNHLKRVAEYSRLIAYELQQDKNSKWSKYITSKYIEDIGESSILHDIGKVGIPDQILFKAGKLTEDEYEKIKKHTTIGGKALQKAVVEMDADYLKMGREIAHYHHEKYDGTGYPEGLKGEQIPLSARIVSLADVYDALTTNRSYRKKMPHDKAAKIIIEEMGESTFDPDVLNIFKKNISKFKKISSKYKHEKNIYLL